MNTLEAIKCKQEEWAVRRGIQLGGPFRYSADVTRRQRGRKLWTYELTDNLFEPLLAEAQEELESGDGRELVPDIPGEGNMYAVHSSSALACNLFHYWRRRQTLIPIARACGIKARECNSMRFEIQHEIDPRFSRAPNLDVEIGHGVSDRLRATGIECKFCEPFSGREHGGLASRYLDLSDCWKAYPALRALAAQITPRDKTFKRFHAAQVIKHILGLSRSYGPGRFLFLYVFYEVPGPEGDEHRDEIELFQAVASKDQLQFRAETYQEILRRVTNNDVGSHARYPTYMAERYL